MKFAFVTCVQLGLSCIERIYDAGGHLDLLISLHDNRAVKKSGRIYLDGFAEKNGIPLLKIDHVNDAEVKEAIREYGIDYLFIIGWSQIADSELINLPMRGTFGIHPTLLPQGRGRASIPWAIIKGLDKTGVTMFRLDEGVDTGPILDQLTISIEKDETATTLYEKVNMAHGELIARAYAAMESDNIQLREQDHSMATVWEGRTPADGEIRLDMTVEQAERLIRATTHPYPGAFVKTDFGKMIIWSARICDNPVNPLQLRDGWIDVIECSMAIDN